MIATLALVVATACRAEAPLPPVVAVGDPVIGLNPPATGTAGEQTKVLRFGPWTVPGATGAGHDQAGMLEDIRLNTERPCSDCYLTGIQPQLRYLDGTVANTDTGLWLHHFAQFSSGSLDHRCGLTLQQLMGENFFNGSNERTQARSPAGAGYRVRPTDRWALMVDFMNTGPTAKEVVLEMTYQWVPGSTPGMHHAKPVWIDINNECGNSVFPAQSGKYSRKQTWTVNVPGRLLGAASHVHDGGTRVTLRNLTTGQLICDSRAHYGGPGFEGMADGHGGHDGGHAPPGGHVSGSDQCVARSIDRPVALLKWGDVLEIEAFYDGDAHPHPLDEDVMGVFFMYVIQE